MNRLLSMKERWAIDRKSGATFVISSPQCEICLNLIKEDALKCIEYTDIKPNDVLTCEKECPKFKSNDPLKANLTTENFSLLIGGIFGFCIGDALGVPVEFEPRSKRKEDKVKEMRAYGTYHQYFGTWSDDTSLTLCLMDSLKNGYNLNDIAYKFVKFYIQKLWTPFGKVFDIGNTIAISIEQIAMGENPLNCGCSKESDNGNGSLMRVLPLAFYLKKEENLEKIRIIEEVSSITHSHKRSKLACIIYVELAINLLKFRDKKKAYENTVDFIMEHCKNDYEEEFINFERVLNKKIYLLKEEEISSSGYVVDSLEASIWCFLKSDSYEESVFLAINLGNDTDTIAAITGGLSGIFYEFISIPDNWVQTLARKKDIYELLLEFNNAICE